MQAGVDIEGLDLFEPMLKTLRAKADTLSLSPRLHQSDMSDFSLPRRYALAMIPFNAFIHNMTQEAQISCLQRCREKQRGEAKRRSKEGKQRGTPKLRLTDQLTAYDRSKEGHPNSCLTGN